MYTDGCAKNNCPYKDIIVPYGAHITWSRAFRSYWFDGWDAAAEQEVLKLIGAAVFSPQAVKHNSDKTA